MTRTSTYLLLLTILLAMRGCACPRPLMADDRITHVLTEFKGKSVKTCTPFRCTINDELQNGRATCFLVAAAQGRYWWTTNSHVVQLYPGPTTDKWSKQGVMIERRVQVIYGGMPHEARVEQSDADADLALLSSEVEKVGGEWLVPLAISDSDPDPGAPVDYWGFIGDQDAVTPGRCGWSTTDKRGGRIPNSIFVQDGFQGGMSGGPLFQSGKVVGVIWGTDTCGRGGFAVERPALTSFFDRCPCPPLRRKNQRPQPNIVDPSPPVLPLPNAPEPEPPLTPPPAQPAEPKPAPPAVIIPEQPKVPDPPTVPASPNVPTSILPVPEKSAAWALVERSVPGLLSALGFSGPIGVGVWLGLKGIGAAGRIIKAKRATRQASTVPAVAAPQPVVAEESGLHARVNSLASDLTKVLTLLKSGGGQPTPTFPLPNGLQGVPTRDTTELHQLVQLGQLEGRDPLLDAAFGMFAQKELQTLADQGDAKAATMLAKLKDQMNRTAPLAVGQ